MTHTLPVFPLNVTPEEHAVGFRRMVLSLGDFIGAYPGESIEVAARRLSDFDVLLKMQVTTTWRNGTKVSEPKIIYRHLRYGYASWHQQIRCFWRDIRFGFWRSWFRGFWPWRVDWQDIPDGTYQSPADDCSRSLSWPGVIGLVFREDAF